LTAKTEKPSFKELIRIELEPARLLPSLTAGIVVGILTVIISVSFAALIFSGEMSEYLSPGIAIALITAVIAGGIISIFSTYAGTIAIPQAKVAPILALISASIITGMAGQPKEVIFLTVVAAIFTASVFNGVLLTLMGKFKLGALIRFIPYPVIGGFLAGTGVLLVIGAIKVMTGVKVGVANVTTLFDSQMLLMWLPGIGFAIALLLVLRYVKHFLAMPAMLIGVIVLFYIVIAIAGVSPAEARQQGFLLDLPSGSLFTFLTVSAARQADWSFVIAQFAGMATIFLVSAIDILLNASALELMANEEIDFDKELMIAGAANIGSGFAGGMVGFHSLSTSSLVMKMGSSSRLTGLTAALISLVICFGGAPMLNLFPKLMLGGLLGFLGLSFLVEWVYDAYFKFSKPDYSVVIMILVIVGSFGYLQGVGAGIIAAVVLFVINYSRISVVKHALSGANMRSNVDRPERHHRLLRQKGEQVYILKLQGFLFFGTANSLLNQVKDRIDSEELSPMRFLLLDFHLVSGIDSSAVLSLLKMKQMADRYDFILILSGISEEMADQLEQGEFEMEETARMVRFADLDHGVEWAENDILTREHEIKPDEANSIVDQLNDLLPGSVDVTKLVDFMDKLEVAEGEYLIKQGDQPDDLYFIESGQVTVLIELGHGKTLRLSKMAGGTVVGEIGWYLNIPRSASVMTEKPSVVYKMSLDTMERMKKEAPDVAAAFHQFMARLLCERLVNTDKTLRAVLD
jgi:sulfate permease, SulP family